MSSRYPICYVSAILASASYLVFSTLAYIGYPPPYSPGANWLSDLGDQTVNAVGARFYNAGIIATGLFLLAWFLGLSQWRIEASSPQKGFLLAARVAGTAGALSLMMSAVYPINRFQQHAFWSHAHFMLLAMGAELVRFGPRRPMVTLRPVNDSR
jgi:hypothetical membrane protein